MVEIGEGDEEIDTDIAAAKKTKEKRLKTEGGPSPLNQNQGVQLLRNTLL